MSSRVVVHRLSRLCVGKGAGRPSVWLGRLLARCLLPVPALVASRSVLPALPQSSLPTGTPQFSLLIEPSTAVFRVCCETVIRSRLVGHVFQSIYSFPSSQQGPCISASAGPEAITQLELQSSLFALTRLFRHWQLNIGCSIRHPSHAHTLTIYTSQFWSRPQQLVTKLQLVTKETKAP